METLKQSLLEHIADWLDSDSTKLDMSIHNLKDNQDLHIMMADAAFNVFNAATTQKPISAGVKHELFDDAAKLVVEHQVGSVSLLRSYLKLGYNAASRLIDELESAEIVGPFEGSKNRKVFIKNIESLEAYLKSTH